MLTSQTFEMAVRSTSASYTNMSPKLAQAVLLAATLP